MGHQGSWPRPARGLLRAAAEALGGIGLAGGVIMASYPRWRTWCLTWGATGDEAAGSWPGDELLATPDIVSTRAVGIAAPAAAVWPWLVQMGPARGGAYTYDWIENLGGLGMHSADRIIPEYQDLKVGDTQALGARGPVLRVAVLDPERALVLRADDGNWVWAFTLVADGVGTRLISRNRIALPGSGALMRLATRYVMEPGSLLMERKMLLGIKSRAERVGGHPLVAGADHPDVVSAAVAG